MLRQESPTARALRLLQIPLSAALLWGFFQPWSSGMGGSATAMQLRERLAAPHRLSTFLKREGRVSRDYRLAGQIWMLGVAEGATMASTFVPALSGWPGLVTGVAAGGTAHWTGKAIEKYPFQKSGRGIGITLWAGSGLAALSLLRILAARK